MLSIRALGNLGEESSAAKAVSSYFKDAYTDYYVKNLDENFVGDWVGKGSKSMGLSGAVDKESLSLALSGQAGKEGVKNAGAVDRQMGWDLTFSAPKSVSIVWAFGSKGIKKEIEQAHIISSRKAFQFIEDKITTRIGAGGKLQERALIAAANFLHFTSREGDPQLHSHFVIPNLSINSNGKYRTIVSKEFYNYKMVVGAFYQAELALQMKKLGYKVEEGIKGTFRLSTINNETERVFSKRSEEINLIAQKMGADFYASQRGVVLLTRPSKTYTTLDERIDVWEKEKDSLGIKFNFEKDKINYKTNTDIDHTSIFKKILQKLTEKQSFFQEKDILLEIARAYQGLADIDGIKKVMFVFMQKSGVVLLGINKYREPVYTTTEIQDLEAGLLASAIRLNSREFRTPMFNISKYTDNLNQEQKTTVSTIINKYGLCVVEGRAGTGKTTLLNSARQIFNIANIPVEGICFTGRAANELNTQSGIPTRTIHSWLIKKEIVKNSVLIVDEAGLIGSRQLNDIFVKAEQHNCKVVLVGDPRQLQPIEAGGPLHMIDKKLAIENPECFSQLHTIMRQKDAWMKAVVQVAASGESDKAIDLMYEKKHIGFFRTAGKARQALISDYISDFTKGAETGSTQIILANRAADVNKINKEIRDRLKENGIIQEKGVVFSNGDRLIEVAVGDQIMFTRNNYNESLQVRNGQIGRVLKANEKENSILIETTDGKKRNVNFKKYNNLDYGWATTSYKAQGITVDKSYVFGYAKDQNASQQSTYVSLSRAKENTTFYIVGGEVALELPIREYEGQIEEEEASEHLKSMKRVWNRDATKFTSLDMKGKLRKYNEFSEWYRQEDDIFLDQATKTNR